MFVETSFALSELRTMKKNKWLIITPAHRNPENRVDVWDLVYTSEKKTDAVSQLKKLRKSGLQNAVLYYTKSCQCNIKLVGKSEDEVWLPEECAEFMRCFYGLNAV